MKNLFRECTECDGYGYVTIDLNDTHIPYEQKEVDYTCMYCDGKGLVLDEDELPFRIEDLNDMIEGMQTRMRLHSDTIIQCEKGMLYELKEKYLDRLDTCARALGRLTIYKNKLLKLVAN